jgi:hypothetical protein
MLGADAACAGAAAASSIGLCTSKGSWHTAQIAEPCPALATPGNPAPPGDAAAASASRAADEALCTTRYGWFTACKGNIQVINLEFGDDLCHKTKGWMLWRLEGVRDCYCMGVRQESALSQTLVVRELT